jgi:hypothetical protein
VEGTLKLDGISILPNAERLRWRALLEALVNQILEEFRQQRLLGGCHVLEPDAEAAPLQDVNRPALQRHVQQAGLSDLNPKGRAGGDIYRRHNEAALRTEVEDDALVALRTILPIGLEVDAQTGRSPSLLAHSLVALLSGGRAAGLKIYSESGLGNYGAYDRATSGCQSTAIR